VSDSAASHLVDLRNLRLDTAHALVAQAGGSEAALQRETPALYLQTLIDGLCELSLKDPLPASPTVGISVPFWSAKSIASRAPVKRRCC
jgi:hypothetical protein